MLVNKLCFVFSFFVLTLAGSFLQAGNSVSPADIGNKQAKQGNYAQALESLNSAIQMDPTNARAYKLRGHVYYAMGNYSRALADLDFVVTLAPDSANALADRAIVHSVRGNHGFALVDIERALALKPSSSFVQAVRKEILERAR